MNKRNRKKMQLEYAKKAIQSYFDLIKDFSNQNLDSKMIEKYEKEYVKEILNIASSFTIRLTKEEKYSFCKKCFSCYKLTGKEKNVMIRLNSQLGTKEYRCLKCNNIRRIKYKN